MSLRSKDGQIPHPYGSCYPILEKSMLLIKDSLVLLPKAKSLWHTHKVFSPSQISLKVPPLIYTFSSGSESSRISRDSGFQSPGFQILQANNFPDTGALGDRVKGIESQLAYRLCFVICSPIRLGEIPAPYHFCHIAWGPVHSSLYPDIAIDSPSHSPALI